MNLSYGGKTNNKRSCIILSHQRADIGRYRYAAQHGPTAASRQVVSIEAVKVNTNMSVIKPTSANWIVFAFDCIRYVPDIICNGFSKAGIDDALKHI